jgi:beta-glucanase (GH16 family)
MSRRLSLALGASITGALVLFGSGIGVAIPAGAGVAGAAATGAAASRAPRAVAPPPGNPEFSATFAGTTLNTKVWDTCYPKLPNFGGGCTNWGNPQEAEWYTPSQVTVSGGYLRLTATRKSTAGFNIQGSPKTYGCASGMVTTYPGFKFEYGFVQIVADLPHAAGLWPALWLGAASGQSQPESDMIETWGVNHEEAAFFHPIGNAWSKGSIPLSLTQGWQTYTLSWTSSKLTFYVGSRIVLTVTKAVPHQLMYVIANLAEYVPATAGTCTGTMLIKSVKVWK